VEIIVPGINVDVIESLINLALVTIHEVELVNNCTLHHPVPPWVTLNHGGHFIDFNYVSWSEAVWIKDNAIISIHASLNTRKELMCEVEKE